MRSSCPHSAGARRRPRDSPHVPLPSTWSAALPFSVPPRTRRSPTRSKARAQPPRPLPPRASPHLPRDATRPLNARAAYGCPLRRLRAPAPPRGKTQHHPSARKATGGTRATATPSEVEPRKSPCAQSIPLIQGRPLNERPAYGCPLRRLRAPAPHTARHNITPAPVKPQGVPVRRPPTPKPSPKAPVRQPPPPKPSPKRPPVKRPDTQTGRPLQGYPPAPA